MDYNNIFSPQAASDIKEQVASADIPRKLSGKESFERKMAAEMSPQAAVSPQAAHADSQNKLSDTDEYYRQAMEAYAEAIIAAEEKRGTKIMSYDYPTMKK